MTEKNRTLVTCALCFVVAIGSTISLRGDAPQALPGADEIIARHAQARGGLERLRSLRSLIYRGTYHEGDHAMPGAAMAVMRPFYKLVGDPERPNPDFAEGYDGSAWEFYGDPGIEREDRDAVLWSYQEFRRAYPGVDSDSGIQAVGYQILKMGDLLSAIALLEAHAVSYPRSSGAFFGLGRAYRAAERSADATAAFEKALALDPANKRARAALDEMVGKTAK